MKIFLSIISMAAAVALSAQVSIEKDFTGNSSVLMEFNDTRESAKTSTSTTSIGGENKTLILPILSELNAGTSQGTIWFDATDDIIKYKSASATINMTEAGSDVNSPNLAEIATLNGTIVGAESSTAAGVLVLEATDKAMVLPVVDGVAAVVNPEPGSLVYDKRQKSIAVFNGAVWSFWQQ
ncbi:hypothetical protein NMK71_06225 [Weeksellaceae bacterium KMM 9713]|uniref:Uncharacterized protein n=1 Tax=Profundicola chukchiensis TaxID=2961959 RepID=A0A9X4RXA6_9FLAO|nr:hypothetical protein [Profundicola chukchiensis]MDG4946004.1 hypothetical protein [Profundicola chukchiensis]